MLRKRTDRKVDVGREKQALNSFLMNSQSITILLFYVNDNWERIRLENTDEMRFKVVYRVYLSIYSTIIQCCVKRRREREGGRTNNTVQYIAAVELESVGEWIIENEDRFRQRTSSLTAKRIVCRRRICQHFSSLMSTRGLRSSNTRVVRNNNNRMELRKSVLVRRGAKYVVFLCATSKRYRRNLRRPCPKPSNPFLFSPPNPLSSEFLSWGLRRANVRTFWSKSRPRFLDIIICKPPHQVCSLYDSKTQHFHFLKTLPQT
jgi:hypothetical protein